MPAPILTGLLLCLPPWDGPSIPGVWAPPGSSCPWVLSGVGPQLPTPMSSAYWTSPRGCMVHPSGLKWSHQKCMFAQPESIGKGHYKDSNPTGILSIYTPQNLGHHPRTLSNLGHVTQDAESWCTSAPNRPHFTVSWAVETEGSPHCLMNTHAPPLLGVQHWHRTQASVVSLKTREGARRWLTCLLFCDASRGAELKPTAPSY